MTDVADRCRLVLVIDTGAVAEDALRLALSGGDVASAILFSKETDSPEFEAVCKKFVPILQENGVAAIVADDTRAFGRSSADGIFADREKPNLADLVARFSPHSIVGCGNIKNRHNALLVGEAKPDFVFFGKLEGDIRPEPHKKNLGLAEWWSELVQLSAIVMGGTSLESVIACAETGAEFVALAHAVFDHEDGPQSAVAEANSLLDTHAPRFEDET